MQPSKDLLFQLESIVKKKGFISADTIDFINKIFSDKSERVLEVIGRGIKRNVYLPSGRILWTAIGEETEHIIYPKLYCSCQDFYKNVVIKKKQPFCKHIIAQAIAEVLNEFNIIEIEDDKFGSLIKKISLKF
jgi:predicted nucleic acid-binding Zn finger protein